MTQFQCSAKLSKYLRKVEVETGRKVELRFAAKPGIAGMPAAFKLDPSCLLILLKEGTDLGNPEIEHTIAHEATHGYLLYKLGYSYPREKRKPTRNEMEHVSLLVTMIDDIVVNRIIQKEGFTPFSPRYLGQVERETKAARKGSDKPYDGFSYDPLFKDRFMVFRYILAWGFVKIASVATITSVVFLPTGSSNV